MLKKENQCLRCEKVAPGEPLVKEEVTQLEGFLRSKEQERVEPSIDQAALIIFVNQSMFAMGLMVAPSTSILHLLLDFPTQQFPQQQFVFEQPPLQHFSHHMHSHQYIWPPIRHIDPRMWGPPEGPSTYAPIHLMSPHVITSPPR